MQKNREIEWLSEREREQIRDFDLKKEKTYIILTIFSKTNTNNWFIKLLTHLFIFKKKRTISEIRKQFKQQHRFVF